MWTLLFLIFSAPVPAGVLVDAPLGMGESVAIEVVVSDGHVTDGSNLIVGSRIDARVRRRRVKRISRRTERRAVIRTVRPGHADEQRRMASDVALRIQRARAVARRVARATRQSHLPARIGSSDTRPPAA